MIEGSIDELITVLDEDEYEVVCIRYVSYLTTDGDPEDRRAAVGLTGTTIMIGLGTASFLLLATGVLPVVLVGVPMAFATAWGWLGLFNLAVLRLNPVAPGAATGITQPGAFVGGVAGPLCMAAIAERFS